ncbi:MAG: hypothetical protein AAFP70_00425 [Calditrichota bacterium]
MQKLSRSEFKLEHNLNSLFPELKAFKNNLSLKKSSFYRQHGAEFERVANGIEYSNLIHDRPGSNRLRVVAWNIERGIKSSEIIRFIQSDPRLQETDVFLLTETDIGMGRSGNINVPAEIATALDMNYCYANSFLVLAKGDEGEQTHESENTLSMHGTAILSRYPVKAVANPVLPSMRDYMKSSEQRLGSRRGLICSIQIGTRIMDFAAAHLELKTSSLQRSKQLASMLKPMLTTGSDVQLFGGDLNTHTYNLKNKFNLLASFLYKVLYVGVPETIVQYMQPDRYFERPVFDVFKKYGFDIERFNNRRFGTLYYNLGEAAASIKTRKWAPEFIHNWLKEILKPYGGEVPFRLDWMAGRGFDSARTIVTPVGLEKPVWEDQRLSDHDPLIVDIQFI